MDPVSTRRFGRPKNIKEVDLIIKHWPSSCGLNHWRHQLPAASGFFRMLESYLFQLSYPDFSFLLSYRLYFSILIVALWLFYLSYFLKKLYELNKGWRETTKLCRKLKLQRRYLIFNENNDKLVCVTNVKTTVMRFQAVRCHVNVNIGRIAQSRTCRFRRRAEHSAFGAGTGSVERHCRSKDTQEDDGKEY